MASFRKKSNFQTRDGISNTKTPLILDVNTTALEYIDIMNDFQQNKKHILGLAAPVLYNERNPILDLVERPTREYIEDEDDNRQLLQADLDYEHDKILFQNRIKSAMDEQKNIDHACNRAISLMLDSSFMSHALYIEITTHPIYLQFIDKGLTFPRKETCEEYGLFRVTYEDDGDDFIVQEDIDVPDREVQQNHYGTIPVKNFGLFLRLLRSIVLKLRSDSASTIEHIFDLIYEWSPTHQYQTFDHFVKAYKDFYRIVRAVGKMYSEKALAKHFYDRIDRKKHIQSLQAIDVELQLQKTLNKHLEARGVELLPETSYLQSNE
jgi:hypothetical protein